MASHRWLQTISNYETADRVKYSLFSFFFLFFPFSGWTHFIMPLTNRQECRKTYLCCAVFQKMIQPCTCTLSVCRRGLVPLQLPHRTMRIRRLFVARAPCEFVRFFLVFSILFPWWMRRAAMSSHARANEDAEKVKCEMKWCGFSAGLMQCIKIHWAAAQQSLRMHIAH